MDRKLLREKIRPLVILLYARHTEKDLVGVRSELDLPNPAAGNSKQERMSSSFDALPDECLVPVAERLLKKYPPSPADRNEIQDILWADLAAPAIPKKHRREVARAIDREELYLDVGQFDKLLDQLWILSDPISDVFGALISGWKQPTLRESIRHHVHNNPGDWSTEELFAAVGAVDCSDRRFGLFLEGLSGPDVRPNEDSQRRFAGRVNDALKNCGAELRETDGRDGYPCFRLVSIHEATAGRPKNLIFASSTKPDLRFSDAINNDVEIVTGADKVLVYDRPIGLEGIRWNDLQSWWAATQRIEDEDHAKKTLYRRLLASLPDNSPPQRLLFEAYFKCFGPAIPELPALLPEVWLHWDPKTVRERGPLALLRFRMDFLMLLPGGVRIVIEVDGKQHYANHEGWVDPPRYAATMAADRELKLAGYHVFRFGAAELNEECGNALAEGFYESMFRHFKVGQV